MKRIFLLLGLLILATGILLYRKDYSLDPFGKKQVNILFIGNSLTFYNNLPREVCKILNQEDSTNYYYCKMIARGGKFLRDHLSELRSESNSEWSKELKTAAQDSWDLIVLQEQSMVVGFKKDHHERIAHGIALQGLVHAFAKPGTVFGLFMTWGFVEGDKKFFPKQFSSFPLMNEKLEIGFEADAKILKSQGFNVLKFPVSKAFRRVWDESPKDIFPKLYLDDRHPSEAGTCLAAWVFAKQISEVELTNSKCRMQSMSSELARYLKRMGAE